MYIVVVIYMTTAPMLHSNHIRSSRFIGLRKLWRTQHAVSMNGNSIYLDISFEV